MEALQNGQTTVEGSIEGQSAGAASHAMIEKILSEEPRWQGTGGHTGGQAPSRRTSVLTPLLPIATLRIGSPPPTAFCTPSHHLCWEVPAPSSHLPSSQAQARHSGAPLGESPRHALPCAPHTDVHTCC